MGPLFKLVGEISDRQEKRDLSQILSTNLQGGCCFFMLWLKPKVLLKRKHCGRNGLVQRLFSSLTTFFIQQCGFKMRSIVRAQPFFTSFKVVIYNPIYKPIFNPIQDEGGQKGPLPVFPL